MRIRFKPARDHMMAELPSYLDRFEQTMSRFGGFKAHSRKELKDGWSAIMSCGAMEKAVQHNIRFNWYALFARAAHSKELPCFNIFWMHRSLFADHWDATLMTKGFGLDMSIAQFDEEPTDSAFLRRRWLSDPNLQHTAVILDRLSVPIEATDTDF